MAMIVMIMIAKGEIKVVISDGIVLWSNHIKKHVLFAIIIISF